MNIIEATELYLIPAYRIRKAIKNKILKAKKIKGIWTFNQWEISILIKGTVSLKRREQSVFISRSANLVTAIEIEKFQTTAAADEFINLFKCHHKIA